MLQSLRSIVLLSALLGFTLPAQAQTINLTSLQTDLQAAICSNNWNQALSAIAPLLGSPGISADYRYELLQLRSRLQDWRAAQAEFSNLPNCEGVISVTQPSNAGIPSQPLDWYRAVQSLEESRYLPSGTLQLR
jgi:hypothetical protein